MREISRRLSGADCKKNVYNNNNIDSMRFPQFLPKMTPHPQYSLASPQPFNEEVSINLGRESNWNNKDDQEMFIYYIYTT